MRSGPQAMADSQITKKSLQGVETEVRFPVRQKMKTGHLRSPGSQESKQRLKLTSPRMEISRVDESGPN